MKKITFLVFLVFLAIKNYGQCIRPSQFTTTVSDNFGLPQTMATCAYTSTNYLVLQNAIVGEDYIFTSELGNVQKYITVTDLNDVVIEHGYSPLYVTAIANSNVRVHLSDGEDCQGTAACHTVTVQAVLSCPVPTTFAIIDLGATSATFYWQPGGSETAWDVIVLPATSPAPASDLTDGVTRINNSSEYIPTLLPGTAYKFYYRSVCSETEKSPWNVSNTFTTLCVAVNYFEQGFDVSTNIPNCYSKVGSQGSVSVQNSSTAASLPNNLYMGSGGTLSLPPVNNFNLGTHRIRFKMKGSYSAGGVVEFGYLVDPTNSESFVALESFTASSASAYDQYTFEPSLEPEVGTFAFKNLVTNNNAIVIDDIVWEPIPACEDVASVNVDSFSSNGAVLSWTSDASSWETVYGISSANPNPNNLTRVATSETSIVLSDLLPNTSYKIWVRSVCSDNGFGAWVGPVTLKTSCATVTTFAENFDASTAMPSCFKKVGSGGNVYVQSNSSATSLPNVLNISSYMGESAMSYGILSLPSVSNASAGTHRLKFNAKSSSSTGGTLEIGYLTNTEDSASFVPLQSFTSNSSTAFETFIYIPEAGLIESESLAIRHSGVPSYSVLVDNIVWETAPACADVAAIQANEISNNSAKILWTGNTETNWQVAYASSAVTDPNTLTRVAVSDVPNTILSNLSASTNYKVWVRSDCESAGFGAWIGPIQFTTACDPVSSFSENFNASTTMPSCWTIFGGFVQVNSPNSNSPYLSYLNLIATPQVSNASAGTHRLKFKAKAMYSLGASIQVGYMTSYNTVSTFVPLQSFTPTSTVVFEEFYANLGTTPTTGYLAIRQSGTSYNSVSVDDIVWEPIPACLEVDELSVDFFTNNTATVSWEAGLSTTWEIAYAEAADVTMPSDLESSTTAVNTFTFTELLPDMTYKFWVRTVCDNELFSAWVGPLEFKTTCNPILDLPWLEDFESITLPEFPECWTKENGSWTAVDQTQLGNNPFIYTTPNSGNKYIRCYNGAVNNHMWTSGFELQANVSYDFSTFIQGDGSNGWSVAMVYNTVPKASGSIQLAEIYEAPTGILGTIGYEEMRRTFVPTVSGTYFFAVRVNENSTENPFYIAFDDFSLETTNLSNPKFDAKKFFAYPNPVKNILNLSYADNITNVAIFNLLGQQIITKSIKANKGQIDMSDLSAGSYLVKITAENHTQTIKVIKQ